MGKSLNFLNPTNALFYFSGYRNFRNIASLLAHFICRSCSDIGNFDWDVCRR